MFPCLPLPARSSGNSRLPVFWLGVTVTSLTLIFLLHSGQPHAFAPPRAENPLPEQFSRQTFIAAVPEIGYMSEVPTSGPYLRAVAAAWTGDTLVTAK